MDNKRIKNPKQLTLNLDEKNNEFLNNKEELLSYINSIKALLEKNIPQNESYLIKRLNIILIKITCLFESILKENELISRYEYMLKRNENSIRRLYQYIFNLRITIDYQENLILNLTSKEKEYEKLKEKTGACYSNGKIIFNSRKDNEIMILRTENSNLKSFIENKENDIKKKDKEIFKLKEQLLLFNKKKNYTEKKILKNNSLPNISDLKCTYSNININFNEIKHSNILKNRNLSNFHNKTNNNSLNSLTEKTIYIPHHLRDVLSFKDFFNRKNKDNLFRLKKSKNKNFSKINENYNKTSILRNGEKYISVNKSNYNLLSSKKHKKLISHTINKDISLLNFPIYNTPSADNKKQRKILNLKSFNEKSLYPKKKENSISKLDHSKSIKKVHFHSTYISPIYKYSKIQLKKKNLFLK